MKDRSARRESLGEIFTRDFLILATINLSMFFGFQMLNIGLPVYMAQLGAGAHVVGLATTLMTVTATLVRVFTGALLDRFGRMGMLIGGTALMVCTIVSYAIFPVVGIILGLRLLHGLGWGVGSTASSTIAADIIPKRRFAEGMGYFAMTTAIASALAPAVSVELVQGVGAVYMIYVATGITMLALVLSIVETVVGRRKGAKPDAGQAGAEPPNGASGPGRAAQGATVAQAGDPAQAGSPAQAAIPARSGTPADASNPTPQQAPRSKLDTLFERRALVPSILIFFVNVGFGCITTFIALHAQEQGVGGVSSYFLVYAIVTLVTRPYIGKLIDRYGYRIPAILSSLCTAGTLALIGSSTSVVMFAGAGVLGGLGIGTAMGTFQSMAVARVEPWRRGVATSTYMTAFDLGIAVGSLVGGLVAAELGYTPMFFIMALSPVIASVASAAIVKKGDGVGA